MDVDPIRYEMFLHRLWAVGEEGGGPAFSGSPLRPSWISPATGLAREKHGNCKEPGSCDNPGG